MKVDVPSDLQVFIDRLVASGRFSSASEVVCEGISLLAERERLRDQVGVGIAQADRGEVADHDAVFRGLRSLTKRSPGQ